jgi:uncharacterized protein (DUF433 family)
MNTLLASKEFFREKTIYHSSMITTPYIQLPITVDPEVMGGTPVFTGTRVPIKTLFDYLEDDYTLSEFLEYFPTVSRESALALLQGIEQKTLEPIVG